jgi:hypothetical protein
VKQYRLPTTCGFSAWAPQMCFVLFAFRCMQRWREQLDTKGCCEGASQLYLGHSLYFLTACPESGPCGMASRFEKGSVRRPAISGDERWNRHFASHLGRGFVNSFPAAATLSRFDKGDGMGMADVRPHVCRCEV